MTGIADLMRRNLFEVFDQSDPVKRQAAIAELYVESPTFMDPHGDVSSREALNAAVTALHDRFPTARFSIISGPDLLRTAGRLAWSLGVPGEPPVSTGLDVAVVEDGRIARLYTFLDPRK